jgi:hypothetical protein
MRVAKSTLLGLVERFAGELRFPQLFWLTAILFVLDVLIPDLIPFADEILLGLATLLLGSWKKNRVDPPGEARTASDEDAPDRVIDVTPEE